MDIREYGTTYDGRKITSFTLKGADGAVLEFLDYGGKIRRLEVPNYRGRCENVAMSLDFAKPGFGGSLIGRYANRIAGGAFTVDGVRYETPTNIAPDGMPALLHGGAAGFHDKVWRVEPFTDRGDEGVVLSLTSPDGEGGFPGKLDVTVVYTLTSGNVWRIAWEARTDRPTPVNFTHHVYFNLSGEARRPVTRTRVTLAADGYTPLGPGDITTGEIASVKRTVFDFNEPLTIDELTDGQFDHNWVLRSQDGSLAFAASAEDGISGRRLETWTTERGLQFYAGGALHDGLKDQFGRPLFPFAGFAFETQAYPDSVNKPNWPNTILRPGETFRSVTEYRFSTVE